ncbi:MAG: DNA mismatch repair protein MutS [Candidatus Binatia bacterium]|nr:DNA mismatch repair protein MutS [Candidatus Binatia bacterium]
MRDVSVPQEEYRRRADRHAAAERADDKLHRGIGWTRLLILIGIVGLLVAFFDQDLAVGWVLLVAIALFVGLTVWHQTVEARLERSRRGVAFHERAQRRLAGQWRGTGPDGRGLAPQEHEFASDLGVFGAGSLFELYCRAVTPYGGRTLADWFLRPASVPEVLARQDAVRSLIPALDAREEIALAVAHDGREPSEGALRRWCSKPALESLLSMQILSASLLAAFCVSLALFLSGVLGGVFPMAAVLAQVVLIGRVRKSHGHALHAGDGALAELGALRTVLHQASAVPSSSDLMAEVRGVLAEGPRAAAPALESLRRRFELLDSGHNLMFVPLALLIGWEIHILASLERWRTGFSKDTLGWLQAVGCFEALLSFASHAYEAPDEIFPGIGEGPPSFVAEGLAHPLLPSADAVGNDVRLDTQTSLLLVSGSNMSGKSTLLRSIGVNAILAQAGATVRASALSITPLRVGASIGTEDSLLDNRSRFQAEIDRLACLMKIADGDRPLLFLLDELLSGTNSHDRRIGAEAVLRAFLHRGSVGVATTHDLAITAIAEAPDVAATNVHFEDRFSGDEMHFDYRLQEGVVTRSNALALMRLVGLPVEE